MLGFHLGWLKKASSKVSVCEVVKASSEECVSKEDLYISKEDLYASKDDLCPYTSCVCGGSPTVTTEGSFFSSDDMSIKSSPNDLSQSIEELHISQNLSKKLCIVNMGSPSVSCGSPPINHSPFSPQKGTRTKEENGICKLPSNRKRASGGLKFTASFYENAKNNTGDVDVVYTCGSDYGSGRENCKYLFDGDDANEASAADENESDPIYQRTSPVCLGVRSIRKFKRMKVCPNTDVNETVHVPPPVFEYVGSFLGSRNLDGDCVDSSDDEEEELISAFCRPDEALTLLNRDCTGGSVEQNSSTDAVAGMQSLDEEMLDEGSS